MDCFTVRGGDVQGTADQGNGIPPSPPNKQGGGGRVFATKLPATNSRMRSLKSRNLSSQQACSQCPCFRVSRGQRLPPNGLVAGSTHAPLSCHCALKQQASWPLNLVSFDRRASLPRRAIQVHST